MTTENNSSAYALAGNLHFLNDRLRVAAVVGNVDFRYRYWGTGGDAGDAGVSVNIRQQAPVSYLSGRYELFPNLYAGLGYLLGKTETSLRLPLPAGLDDPTLAIDMAAVQLPIDYDTRDDRYFPRSGWLASVRATFYRESVGSDFDADIVTLAVNHYLPLRERDVLATRAYFKSAGGSAPFFLLSSFGGKTDLRGYDMGRYRDNMMYAVQAEYRWRYSKKWVFTGFAGVGEVADNLGGFFNELLPAGGIGARFMLSEKHQVSLSADLSFGKHGGQFYFGIGEAF
jgi:outer membrane protein assembly factor BamA